MKQIPLTQGKFAIVDDEDYERLVAMGKWYFMSNGYAVRTERYKRENGKFSYRQIRMHREIMGLYFGDKIEVDHINNNRLDNRRCNLRACSKSENNRNASLRKDNLCKFKGVSFNISSKKYRARIKFNKKNIHLGCFQNIIEAAAAYNAAALKYFGEFAKLNQI